MRSVSLVEAAHIIMGQSPPSSTYNNIGTGLPFFQGKTDFGEVFPTVRMYCSAPKKTADPGDILLSVRAPVGPTNVAPMKACIGRGLAAIRAKEHTNPSYLLYFLRFYEPFLSAIGQGSTFEAVGKADLHRIEIPLPPLAEQQRIAGILGRADRLRRLRRYALELSEGYLQAVFLEMFGDIILNPKDWSFQELDEVADIASGVTKGQRFKGKKTVRVPYLRVANVQDGYLDLSEIKSIEALPTSVEKLRLTYEDIVMTEGGDFDKLGRGAIWEGQIEKCIHQNHIFRVRLDKNYVLPNYFAVLLLTRYTKSYFLRASKQTTNLATINMTQLRAFPVPVPPLKLQNQFVAVVRQNKRLRAQQSEALRQAEHLFQALLQRAFRGER